MSKELWLLLDTVLPHKGVFYLHKRRDVLWMVIRTLKHTENTLKGVSFLVIYLFWTHICTIWAWKGLYFPIFMMLHPCWHLSWCYCDLDILANARQHSMHPQEGAVKVSAQSEWQFPRYSHFCDHPLVFLIQPFLTIWDWNLASEPTSLASMPATPVLSQAPVNVPLHTYDWNAADQMGEFHLFKCQLETWFWLCEIKAEECLDYLLCILGKEGYVAMGCWVLPDEGHKMRSGKIPWLHQKQLKWQDLPMSPCLWTGGCQEEVWWIYQWTHRQGMPTCLPCTDRWW